MLDSAGRVYVARFRVKNQHHRDDHRTSRRTQALILFCDLAFHVDRPLPGFLQQTDELEHRAVLEAHLRLGAVRQPAARRRLDLERKVVRAECGLLEARCEDRRQRHRKRLERRPGVRRKDELLDRARMVSRADKL